MSNAGSPLSPGRDPPANRRPVPRRFSRLLPSARPHQPWAGFSPGVWASPACPWKMAAVTGSGRVSAGPPSAAGSELSSEGRAHVPLRVHSGPEGKGVGSVPAGHATLVNTRRHGEHHGDHRHRPLPPGAGDHSTLHLGAIDVQAPLGPAPWGNPGKAGVLAGAPGDRAPQSAVSMG